MRRRTLHQPWEAVMSEAELDKLSRYNSEKARGLVHRDEYAAEMKRLQTLFNAAYAAAAATDPDKKN